MADFVELAGVAETLIAENGRDVTFKRVSRTAGDAAKPWRGPSASPESLTVRGCFVPPSGSGFGHDEMDSIGSLLRGGNQVILVAAKAVGTAKLEEYDSILDGTDVWKIAQVAVLKPGSVTVLYAVEVMK